MGELSIAGTITTAVAAIAVAKLNLELAAQGLTADRLSAGSFDFKPGLNSRYHIFASAGPS
jgi:hypothetical protein